MKTIYMGNAMDVILKTVMQTEVTNANGTTATKVVTYLKSKNFSSLDESRAFNVRHADTAVTFIGYQNSKLNPDAAKAAHNAVNKAKTELSKAEAAYSNAAKAEIAAVNKAKKEVAKAKTAANETLAIVIPAEVAKAKTEAEVALNIAKATYDNATKAAAVYATKAEAKAALDKVLKFYDVTLLDGRLSKADTKANDIDLAEVFQRSITYRNDKTDVKEVRRGTITSASVAKATQELVFLLLNGRHFPRFKTNNATIKTLETAAKAEAKAAAEAESKAAADKATTKKANAKAMESTKAEVAADKATKATNAADKATKNPTKANKAAANKAAAEAAEAKAEAETTADIAK